MKIDSIKAAPNLGIVVPCFNEEDVLGETAGRLLTLLSQMREIGLIGERSAVYYIDDGSSDGTWELIEQLTEAHAEICGIRLSRNCGHQNALLCGLMTASGDMLISVDADLQDDLDVIPKMVELYREGHEIVYGVRKRRDTDTFFKRFTAEAYYKFMAALGVDMVYNHADYRLLSRRALEALSQYQEANLFLRGLVRLLGYKSATVEYDRAERFAGESKYTVRKMLSFAWQGVTSFSTGPLRLITVMGAVVSLASIALGLWGFGVSLFTDKALPGWASTVVPIYFLGGVQLLCLGVIGEYVAKIYMESKRRPRFHVDTLSGSVFRHDRET